MHSGSLTVLHSLNISAHRVISAHLQLLIQNFEGKIVRIKFPSLNPVAIFHLPAILHVSAELSSPQPTLSYRLTLPIFLCKRSYGLSTST